jgi:predicted transcriptional regulator
MGTFVKLFGRSPRVAIIEAFSENPDSDLSVPEVVRISGISRRAVYMHVRKMLKEGILIKTKKVGKGLYFKFNSEDPRGEALAYLESVLTLGSIEHNIRRDENTPAGAHIPTVKSKHKANGGRPAIAEILEHKNQKTKPAPTEA